MQSAVVLVTALTGLLGLWAAWFAVTGRAVILRQLIGAGVVEAALVGQGVVAAVGQGRGHDVADPWTFWGYLLTAAVLLPVAAVWAVADRTRWSSVVLVVACLAIAAMEARVWQLWTA